MPPIKKNEPFVQIPMSVKCNPNLKLGSKLLFGDIYSMCKMGSCFATDKYFASEYGVSRKTISDWVQELVSEGIIESHIKICNNKTQRVITVVGFRASIKI